MYIDNKCVCVYQGEEHYVGRTYKIPALEASLYARRTVLNLARQQMQTVETHGFLEDMPV